MTINPFVAGIVVTIFVEVVLINILVIASIIADRKSHPEDNNEIENDY